MHALSDKHKKYFSDKSFVLSTCAGFLMLFASFIINFYAGTYATEKASSPVLDIILSNIPVFDVSIFFIYGPAVLWTFVAILCLREPKRIPFVLKSIALFVLIRSFFITLTHIGPFPDQTFINLSNDLIGKFTFGGDLFFSAHTGLPFLMALAFWKDFGLRIFFITSAIFFGIIVLLGHLHYSIDVMSAFFITYSIYHIALWVFKKDSEMFDNGLVDKS